jgi:WD40 repeat protein/predicted Ser/Thr protein kinase
VDEGLETLRSSDGETEPSPAHGIPIQIGRYVILRRIGEGGMGVVYAAYDNELDRKLAIKLVRAERALDDESRTRVRREAQAMARLSHPNVVQVYEVGEHDGQIYVAMEFVTGPTLAEWAATRLAGPTRWQAILEKYCEAGRGLAAAHAAGIVHRDFKPANAIVGEDGRVRVLDFGIARAPDVGQVGDPVAPGVDDPSTPEPTGDPLATPLTTTGAMLGTPAYMSPEQFERQRVDARSDQFSFCVALYEALHGERPFAASTTPALMLAVLANRIAPAPANAEVPSWVRELVVRGLAREPERRWPTMTELLAALANDPARRRRSRRLKAGFAIVTLAAIGGLAWFAQLQLHHAKQADADRREALRQEASAQRREAEAEAERDRALREAQAAAVRARDTARILAARGLTADSSAAAALLRDVERPAEAPGWRSTAIEALQQPLSEQVLRGHEDRVVYLDVSPDDRWLVSASFDGTARIWPLDGSAATVLQHDDRVLSAAFSPDGRSVLTAAADGIAAVWPMPARPGESAGEPLRLRGHTDMLWSAQFSYDGTKVVTASRDGTARVWTLDRPEVATVLRVGDTHVWWAEFSRDGQRVLAAGGDGKARVWRVDEPERPPVVLEGHTASVGDAHFGGRGDRVVTASADGTARLFEIDLLADTARTLAVLEHDGDVHRVRFGPGELLVATASRDRSAKLWTFDDAGALVAQPRVFDDHVGLVWAAELSPDARFLAIGARDRAVEVWPLAGGPPLILRGHNSDVFRVRFSNDGRRLFTGSHDGIVRVWSTDWQTVGRTLLGSHTQILDLEAGGDVLVAAGEGGVSVWPVFEPGAAPIATHAPTLLGGHRGTVRAALSERPRVLATGDGAGRVRLWSIAGTDVREPDRPLTLVTATESPVITAIALDASAELLAVATLDGAVDYWRLPRPLAQPLAGPRRLTTHAGPFQAAGVVGFSPDSQWFASAGTDGRVVVWTRDELLGEPGPGRTLGAVANRVAQLVFSPDSRRVVVSGVDRQTVVFQLDGESIELEHSGVLLPIAFDSSSRYLVGGGTDARVAVWDLEDPGAPRILAGPTTEIRDVGFAPDDRLLAAVSLDGIVHVWPLHEVDGVLAIGEPLMLDARESAHRLAFVDAGRRIAVAGIGPAIRLWYLGEGLDLASLHGRLQRGTSLCLTAAQRMQFVGESPEAAEHGVAACLHSPRE